MPLPTLQKTWVFDTNNRITFVTVIAGTKELLFNIKQTLKLMTGMSVKGSSDGTTAAMDAVDRWTTAATIGARTVNITTAATSWIVLTSSVMGVDICLSFIGVGDQQGRVAYSVGGYSLAGTPTFHPTSTDQQVPHGTLTAGSNLNDSTASLDRLWHMAYASDGSCWWFFVVRNNLLVGSSLIMMQKASSTAVVAPATFSPATWAYGSGSATNADLQIALLCNINAVAGVQNPVSRANNGIGGGDVSIDHAAFALESFSNGTTPSLNNKYTFAPELQGGFLMQGLALHSFKGVTRGKLCNVIDVWCSYAAATLGDTYPNDATRQFIVLGGTSGLVLPWDGTVFVGA
jgi:hypothetical protein